jgi:hypothetical protein
MEIEREAPGNERARSWRANAAQEDSKKLEDSDQVIKVGCLSICIYASGILVQGWNF